MFAATRQAYFFGSDLQTRDATTHSRRGSAKSVGGPTATSIQDAKR